MLIHGEKDELIRIHHSEALCKSMRTAQLLRVTGAGHSDVHQFPTVRKALLSALGRLVDGGSGRRGGLHSRAHAQGRSGSHSCGCCSPGWPCTPAC